MQGDFAVAALAFLGFAFVAIGEARKKRSANAIIFGGIAAVALCMAYVFATPGTNASPAPNKTAAENADADPTESPQELHAARQAILDYWNPIAMQYIVVRSHYAAVGVAANSGDVVDASSELEQASRHADSSQSQVFAMHVPEGVQMSDDCPQTNMMFVYLKDSFDKAREGLDSGKPSDAADTLDSLKQADAQFFACRHALASQFQDLGGDPSALDSINLNADK